VPDLPDDIEHLKRLLTRSHVALAAAEVALHDRDLEIEQAKLTHSRAIVDHRKAVAKVDALTGDLLERYGIELEAENR